MRETTVVVEMRDGVGGATIAEELPIGPCLPLFAAFSNLSSVYLRAVASGEVRAEDSKV